MSGFTLNNTHLQFVETILMDLRQRKQHNKLSVEKIASCFGIENRNLIKELTELAIVKAAREIAHDPKITIKERFWEIVSLYESQVNLSHRTSHSMLLQQYSTPAPIAFLCGNYVLNKDNDQATYFEPSAGNGLLTIALPYEHTWVNEIDDVRFANLLNQPFAGYSSANAAKPFTNHDRQFDGIITNPPFGTLDISVKFGEYKISTLDHLMAIYALDCMKDDGRAAIIIGGHTTWDKNGRIQAGKNWIFFNYLNHHYQVDDVLNLDGYKLYSRQGTAFDVRLILISGRKKTPEGFAPLKRESDTVISSFNELWERVSVFFDDKNRKEKATQIERTLFKEITMAGSPIKIYRVNASQVRDQFDSDWNQGGHHYAGVDGQYNYIPIDEVWIDGNLNEKDTKAVILHELFEYFLMTVHAMTYDQAHERAKAEEQKFRDGIASMDLQNKNMLEIAREKARIRIIIENIHNLK